MHLTAGNRIQVVCLWNPRSQAFWVDVEAASHHARTQIQTQVSFKGLSEHNANRHSQNKGEGASAESGDDVSGPWVLSLPISWDRLQQVDIPRMGRSSQHVKAE
jgi:hypothetical protein